MKSDEQIKLTTKEKVIAIITIVLFLLLASLFEAVMPTM